MGETAETARTQIEELASRLLGFEGNIQEIKNYRNTKDLDESKKLMKLRRNLDEYKEALAVAHVEKDEVENKYESKMSFLDNELNATLHSKDQIEAALTSEIAVYQAKLLS